MRGPDGRARPTDAADTISLLRIVEMIPSPKVEPFMRWLSGAAIERPTEVEDPEQIIEQARQLYRQRGYAGRLDRPAPARHCRPARADGEWKRRGLREGDEYRALTNAITEGTFGMDVATYRQYKGLRTESLRDDMTDLELVLTMLGEATASRLHRVHDSHGFAALDAARAMPARWPATPAATSSNAPACPSPGRDFVVETQTRARRMPGAA